MRNTLMHPSILASAGAAVPLIAVTAVWPHLWPFWIAWLILAVIGVVQARRASVQYR